MAARGRGFFLPPGWSLVAGGLGILALLLLLPEGLGGLVYELRDRYLRWVARRRGIVVASLGGEAAAATTDEDLVIDLDLDDELSDVTGEVHT